MRITAICSLVLLLAIGCKPEVKVSVPIDRSLVKGDWTLIAAQRNGKSTETLDETFFRITSDSLTTNIFGEESQTAIGWGDSLIYPADSVVVYRVEKVSSDSLNLKFTLQRFNFNILLGKGLANE